MQKMNNLNRLSLLQKLNDLMECEVEEIFEYSTTSACSVPKDGLETQYDKQKRKIQLIQSAKDDVLFSFFTN